MQDLREFPNNLIDPSGTIRDVFCWNFPQGPQTGNVSRESRPGADAEEGAA